MIRRYILHVEVHRGYWPKIKLWRKPQHGQTAIDGGEWGKIVACPTCSTDGFLFKRNPKPGEHHWEGSVCRECEADVSWCDHPPQNIRPFPEGFFEPSHK